MPPTNDTTELRPEIERGLPGETNALSQEIPAAPSGYPTADPAVVQRARTDGGLRLRLVRALWSGNELPTPYAQTGGYIYEIADKVALEVEGRSVDAAPARVQEPTNRLVKIVLDHQWHPLMPLTVHSRHKHHPECAVCVGDVERVLAVVFTAAPAAMPARAHEPMEPRLLAVELAHQMRIMADRIEAIPIPDDEFARHAAQSTAATMRTLADVAALAMGERVPGAIACRTAPGAEAARGGQP